MDNRCSTDAQQASAMKVLSDKTWAFTLSAFTEHMHVPHLESMLPKDRLHTCLNGSGPRVGAQGPGLGLRAWS